MDTPDTPHTDRDHDGQDGQNQNQNQNDTTPSLTVGARVRAHPGTDDETRGVVLEDFGENVGVPNVIGEHRIVEPARRWAVALDTGALVFLDSDQLLPEPITIITDGGEEGQA